MKCKYSVSFEFDVRPVLTHKGEVEAISISTCSGRAFREAKSELKPRGWRSAVCVLERTDVESSEDKKGIVGDI